MFAGVFAGVLLLLGVEIANNIQAIRANSEDIVRLLNKAQ
jgi:hypothetical protein